MKYSGVILALASSAMAVSYPRAANGTIVYTTEIVTELTTYCPVATEIPYGHGTYHATAGETVTITDCPCTVTKPVAPPAKTLYYTSCDEEKAPPAPTKVIPVPTDIPCPEASSLTIIPNPGAGCPGGEHCPGGNSGATGGVPAVCPGGEHCPPATAPGVPAGTGVIYPTGPQFTGAASANKVGGLLAAAAGVAALVL